MYTEVLLRQADNNVMLTGMCTDEMLSTLADFFFIRQDET